MLLLAAWKGKKRALAGISVIAIALLWPMIQLQSFEVWLATLTAQFPNNIIYPAFAFFAGTYTVVYLYQRQAKNTCPAVPQRTGTAASLVGVVLGFCPACIPALLFFLPLSVTIAIGHLSWVILLAALVFLIYSIFRMQGFSQIPGAERQQLFECKECGFLYRERKWAERCTKWCAEHKSCNLEIIAHAIHGSEKER